YCTDFYQLKLPIDFSVKNAHLCAGSVKNKYPYMAKILVTGGCGYIGSHTVVDLIQNGYDVISVDNNSRSNPEVLAGVERITGKAVKNYKVDLCNYDDTYAVFQENTDIAGIIHFAAYKAVGESVEQPLMYYENNLNSLINILKCVREF